MIMTSERLTKWPHAAMCPTSSDWRDGARHDTPSSASPAAAVSRASAQWWAAGPAASQGANPSAGDNQGGTAPAGSGRIVLVVDDDLLVGMGTAAMVEDLGHVALEATSGADALLLLEARRDIDLIITDHGMPHMSGLDLAHAARKLRPELPVILATGYTEPLTAGAPGVLQLHKPFRQDELAKVIAAALGQRAPAGGGL